MNQQQPLQKECGVWRLGAGGNSSLIFKTCGAAAHGMPHSKQTAKGVRQEGVRFWLFHYTFSERLNF
jgi:hypothetical protein